MSRVSLAWGIQTSVGVLAALVLLGCGDVSGGGDDGGSADVDTDGDGVVDAQDPAPESARSCGDEDADGCDDCALTESLAPEEDGFDPDGDGACELSLDYDCVHGEHAAEDPHRAEACAMLAIANADRAHFADESGDAAPLIWNEAIWLVAIAHSRDTCERGYFSHVTPEGLDPSDRAAVGGLDFGLSENIAVNFDPRAAAYGLMSEPTCIGHRLNLLDRRSIEVGIGYHVCDNPDYDPYGQHHHVVQDFRVDFGRDRSDYCGDPASACELPAHPPSTAVCPEELVDWGFCPPLDASLLDDWGCPVD